MIFLEVGIASSINAFYDAKGSAAGLQYTAIGNRKKLKLEDYLNSKAEPTV